MMIHFTKERLIGLLLLLLVLVTVLAISFKMRLNNMDEELFALKSKEIPDQNIPSEEDKTLQRLDSLMLKSEYDKAYQFSLEFKDSQMVMDQKKIELRVELLSDIMKLKQKLLKKGIKKEIITIQEVDHSDENQLLLTELDHAKVEIEDLRKRLEQSAQNRYLTFTTTKGTPLYYMGATVQNQANGFGIAILQSGSRYEGYWKNNLRHGVGKFYWNDGSYYEGEYSDDLRAGTGTYCWENGDKYIGQWKDDKRNGDGEFYNEKGKLKACGVWENDKLIEEYK